MTYSILLADPATGAVGVAVHSHYPFVGAIVPRTRRGVGVAVAQGQGDPRLAEQLLDALVEGASPHHAVERIVRADDGAGTRQLAVLRVDGVGAAHSGASCVAHVESVVTDGAVACGNLLARRGVAPAMVDAVATSAGPMPARLVRALDAGERAGGDLRGVQSAALLVAPADARDAVDIRVDDSSEPHAELRRLVDLHERYGVLRRDDVPAELLLERVAASARAPGEEELAVWLAVRAARAGAHDEARAALQPQVEREWRWAEVFDRAVAAGG